MPSKLSILVFSCCFSNHFSSESYTFRNNKLLFIDFQRKFKINIFLGQKFPDTKPTLGSLSGSDHFSRFDRFDWILMVNFLDVLP